MVLLAVVEVGVGLERGARLKLGARVELEVGAAVDAEVVVEFVAKTGAVALITP